MRNQKFASYSDEEVAQSYNWIKENIIRDMQAGKDVEKYRVPLKEVGDEVNARIAESLDEIEAVLNTPPGQPA